MKKYLALLLTGAFIQVLAAADFASLLTPAVLEKGFLELPKGLYTVKEAVIPAGFTLQFAPGAVIEVAVNGTLVINGTIAAPAQKVIAGKGKIIGNPENDYILPEWFGAVGDDKTDSSWALQIAADLAGRSRGRMLRIGNGRYRYNRDIVIRSNVDCQGTLVNVMELDPSKTVDRFRVYLPMHYPKYSSRIYILPDSAPVRMKNSNFFNIKRNTFQLPCYKGLALANDPAKKIDLAEGGTLRFLSSDFFTARANNRNDEYYNKEDIVRVVSCNGDVYPEFNFDFDDFLTADSWSSSRNYKKGDYCKVGNDFYKAVLASGKGVMYKNPRLGECETGPRNPADGVRQNVVYTNGRKDKLNFWVKLNYIVEYTPPQQPLTIRNLNVEAFLADDDPNCRVVHTQLVVCQRSDVTFERMSLKSVDKRLHLYNLLSLGNVVGTQLNRCTFSGALMHGMGYNVMQHNVACTTLNDCISTNARDGLAARHGKNITINGGHYNRIDDHYGKNYIIRDCVIDAWSTWVIGYRTPKCDGNKLIRTRSAAVAFSGENITMENCKIYDPRYIIAARADVGDFGGKVVLRDIAVFSNKSVTVVNHQLHADFDYAHNVLMPQSMLLDNVSIADGGKLKLNLGAESSKRTILRDTKIEGWK